MALELGVIWCPKNLSETQKALVAGDGRDCDAELVCVDAQGAYEPDAGPGGGVGDEALHDDEGEGCQSSVWLRSRWFGRESASVR